MNLFRHGLVLTWLFLATMLAHAQNARTSVRLLPSATAVKSGEALMVGLELKMPDGWHTYWRNGGDSGLGVPTKIVWDLPPGVTAGPIQWPGPGIFIQPGGRLSPDYVTYVYEREVVLLIPIKVAPTVNGPVQLKATVTWAECNESECVPGKAQVMASVEVGRETLVSTNSAKLFDWQQKVPLPDPKAKVSASWEKIVKDDPRMVVIEWQAGAAVQDADFFPFMASGFDVASATNLVSKGETIRLRKKVSKFEGNWPKELSGLIGFRRSPNSEREFFETTIPISGSVPSETAPAAAVPHEAPQGLFFMLGAAFLGGLILNFMPCVLPVISLKILGFVQQSKESPARVKQLGLLYGVGVVCSFLVLGAVVIALQRAGHSVSWGMQMQNSTFRVVMIAVTVLIALNLFGVFEVTAGGSAMDAAGTLAAKQGAGGAFFNGVVATALATPCTAPFLAGALGFAFTQSPGVILATFTSAAVGLASPYVLLSCQPSWLKFLPKPGVWMQRFKVAMAFPMLATTFFIFDFSARSFGESGIFRLGLFVVLLTLAAWIWGEFVQRGTRRKGVAIIFCLLSLGSALAALRTSPDQIEWKPWSAAAVENARAEGHPVLVDFTAQWCTTCRVNKATSIEVTSVQNKIKGLNVVALIGDNTDSSPEIDAELKKHGRAGVPLVLVYPKDVSKPPIILPGLLTPDIVLNALDEAAK